MSKFFHTDENGEVWITPNLIYLIIGIETAIFGTVVIIHLMFG